MLRLWSGKPNASAHLSMLFNKIIVAFFVMPGKISHGFRKKIYWVFSLIINHLDWENITKISRFYHTA